MKGVISHGKMEMVIDTDGHTWNDGFCTFYLFFIEKLFTEGNERFGLHELWSWPNEKEFPYSEPRFGQTKKGVE